MIRLAEIYQDNMVLQRQKPVCLMGSCESACEIMAFLNDVCVLVKKAEPGRLSLTLPAQSAMEDAVLRICADDGQTEEEHVFRGVDFGEVWIAGGQSNMEFALRFDAEGDATIEAAEDVHFRFYDVGEYACAEDKERADRSATAWDKWLCYKPEHAPHFSAVAVYFARMLRERLGVPVGVIGCNWGGTSAVSWIPESRLRKKRALRGFVDSYDRKLLALDMQQYEIWLEKEHRRSESPKEVAAAEDRMKNEILRKPDVLSRLKERHLQKSFQLGPRSQHRPGALYEMMVEPIAGYTAIGVLWYQGESDYAQADIYDELLAALIRSWRAAWNEDLPFLVVQLASYEGWRECPGDNFHVIRRKQQKVADEEPGVYLASIMDVGSRYDIHPKQKRPVGERLGRLALNYVYGFRIGCEPPRIGRMWREGDHVTVGFQYSGGGLIAQGPIEPLFEVWADGRRVSCRARLDGSSIVLSAEALANAKNVELAFAYRPYCPMTLFSGEGLCARPLETTAVYSAVT